MAPTARKSPKAPAKARPRAKPAAAERHEPPLLEWCAAALGALLLLGTIGFLTWDAFNGRDLPPDLRVTPGAVKLTAGGYLVQFRVENAGDRPAAQVEVEGRLQAAGEEETATASFDYVPAGSGRSGGVVFSADPRQGRLTLSAKGYSDP